MESTQEMADLNDEENKRTDEVKEDDSYKFTTWEISGN